jgi:putative addiction module component (TIGR02574 family)
VVLFRRGWKIFLCNTHKLKVRLPHGSADGSLSYLLPDSPKSEIPLFSQKEANVTYDKIFRAVLTLPPLYRAMLAEHLLKSLDEINPQVETAWETEIANRIQAIQEGEVALIPADEVLQKLRNR